MFVSDVTFLYTRALTLKSMTPAIKTQPLSIALSLNYGAPHNISYHHVVLRAAGREHSGPKKSKAFAGW